jgi:hypothetical protein
VRDTSTFLIDAGFPGDIPLSVSNQIRNAMNHLASACANRAVDYDDSGVDEVKDDLTNAVWHLNLARRNTLRTSTRILQQNIDNAVAYIRRRGGDVDQKILEHIELARRTRKSIIGGWRRNRTLTLHDDISNSLIVLLTEYSADYKKILDSSPYWMPSARLMRFINTLPRAREFLRNNYVANILSSIIMLGVGIVVGHFFR